MRIFGLILIWVLNIGIAKAQQLFCISLGEYGQSNYCNDIRQCEGGYILAGSTGSNQGDAYLARLGESGNVIWKKSYGTQGLETGYRVAAQPDGFILICRFQSDTGGNYGIWIIKTDLNGDSLWSKYLAGNHWEMAEGVAPLPDSGFVLLSTRYVNDRDIVLRRFDSAGGLVWEKGFWGPDDERGADLLYAQNGQLYIGGEMQQESSEILFAAFNLNGDSLFKRISGSIYEDYCSGITEHSSGRIALSGTTYVEDGTGKLLLLRYTPEGTEDLKIVQLGEINFKIGRIAWSPAGLYFIPFTWFQENNFNLTGYYEFDAEMNYQCSVKLEGQSASLSSAMVAGRENTGIIAGETENPLPSLPQIYVLKSGVGCVSPQITLGMEKQLPTAAAVYPNPAQSILHVSIPGFSFAKGIHLSITDISGRQYTPVWKLYTEGIQVDLAELPESLYILGLHSTDGVHYLKFVKSR